MATSILSPVHLAVVLLVVLLLFGSKRLPELGKSLGSSMRAFKDSIDGEGHHPAAISESTDTNQPAELRKATAVPPPIGDHPPADGPTLPAA